MTAPSSWPAAAASPPPVAQRSASQPALPPARPWGSPSRPTFNVASGVDAGQLPVAAAGLQPSQAPTVQAVFTVPPPAGRGPGQAPTVPAATATAVVQRIEGAAPPPPPESTGFGRSDGELEELAQALFGRIRRRLRSELIHDREAKGLTFDHV